MLNDGWKCYVEFDPGMITNSVYLFRQRDFDHREFFTGTEIITIKSGEKIDNEKIRFARLDDDMVAALMAGFDKFGVKRPEASYTEGKLEATEKHLEDMRSIVGHVKKLPLKKGE